MKILLVLFLLLQFTISTSSNITAQETKTVHQEGSSTYLARTSGIKFHLSWNEYDYQRTNEDGSITEKVFL